MAGNSSGQKGVPGILRPFKEYLEKQGVSKGDQVVYYGVPGSCVPFIELLAFAARGLGAEHIFIPYFSEEKARGLRFSEEIGMQVDGKVSDLKPRVVVIMGGLAMPNIPCSVSDVKTILARHPEAESIGVCFMSMFEKAGWLDEIQFDLLIDATINPVMVQETMQSSD